MVLVEDLQNFSERDLVVVAASARNGLDEFAFFGVGGLLRIDQGQRYFAFAQIVADGLAEDFFARGEI